jgi:uncharacterized membrane protein YkvA (DUF1232 family)
MNTMRRLWRVIYLLRRAGGVRGMKNIAQEAPRYFQLARRLVMDNRVPKAAKAVLLGAGAFAVSPFNLPGFIPFIGLVDDIAVAVFAWNYFIKRVPADVLASHRAAVGFNDGPTTLA